jgi:hypothetical protein
LAAQLQASLLHLLSLLQQSDVPRLKEPLQRRKQQLLQLVSRAAAGDAADADAGQLQEAVQSMSVNGDVTQQQQQQSGLAGDRHVSAAAAADGGQRQQLPSDPFSQDGSWGSNSSTQKYVAIAKGSISNTAGAKPPPSPAAAAVLEPHVAAAGALHGLRLVLGPISLQS